MWALCSPVHRRHPREGEDDDLRDEMAIRITPLYGVSRLRAMNRFLR